MSLFFIFIFLFSFFLLLKFVVLFCEHSLRCWNNHQHDCGHLSKEEEPCVSYHRTGTSILFVTICTQSDLNSNGHANSRVLPVTGQVLSFCSLRSAHSPV